MTVKSVFYFNHSSLSLTLFYGAKIKENYYNFIKKVYDDIILPVRQLISANHTSGEVYHHKKGISLERYNNARQFNRQFSVGRALMLFFQMAKRTRTRSQKIVKNKQIALDFPEDKNAMKMALKNTSINICELLDRTNIGSENLTRILRLIRFLAMILYNRNDQQLTITEKLGGIKNVEVY